MHSTAKVMLPTYLNHNTVQSEEEQYSWKDRQRGVSLMLHRRDKKGGIFQMGCVTLIVALVAAIATIVAISYTF